MTWYLNTENFSMLILVIKISELNASASYIIVLSPQDYKILSSCPKTRQTLGSTHPPTQWKLEAVPPSIKSVGVWSLLSTYIHSQQLESFELYLHTFGKYSRHCAASRRQLTPLKLFKYRRGSLSSFNGLHSGLNDRVIESHQYYKPHLTSHHRQSCND